MYFSRLRNWNFLKCLSALVTIELMNQNTSHVQLSPLAFEDHAFVQKVFRAAMPLYEPLSPGMLQANIDNISLLTRQGLHFNTTGLEAWLISTTTEPIGFAGIGAINPRRAYMAALYFLPDFQQRGYGSLALQWLEGHYHSLGYSEILLLVHSRADWAQRFYQKAGYQVVAKEFASMVDYASTRIEHLIEPGLWLMAKTLFAPQKPQ